MEYEAAEGKEYFIQAVNKDNILFGLIRLRIPNNRKDVVVPELKDAALIRELHVYGQSLKLGEKGEGAQHKGLGKRLMKIAEEIVKKNNINKLAVISGVGVREYYKKLGYELEKYYMIKEF